METVEKSVEHGNSELKDLMTGETLILEKLILPMQNFAEVSREKQNL